MMYLKYSSFTKGEINGLNPEGIVSNAFYHGGPIGFTGISYIKMFDEQFNKQSITICECYWKSYIRCYWM